MEWKRLELEPSPITGFEAAPDRRPRMPEPLPVRLVSVDDVRLPAPAGAERELDAFYVMLLGFEREDVPLARPRPDAPPLLGRVGRGATAPPLALGLRNREQPPTAPPAGGGQRGSRGWPAAAPSGASEEAPQDASSGGPVYRAENFRLRFQTVEPPVVRESRRAQGIEVLSLTEAEAKLIEAEIEYTWERGLVPGRESLLLQDPAGNWVELVESRPTG